VENRTPANFVTPTVLTPTYQNTGYFSEVADDQAARPLGATGGQALLDQGGGEVAVVVALLGHPPHVDRVHIAWQGVNGIHIGVRPGRRREGSTT
jgi:hypothetical protein